MESEFEVISSGMNAQVTFTDKRSSSGYVAPEKPEVWGKIAGYMPARDRVLIKRLAPIAGNELIARPDVAVELSERGYVIAVGPCDYGAPPIGAIATFSKYGAEEKRFDDDEGPNTYATVWIDDVKGWHLA